MIPVLLLRRNKFNNPTATKILQDYDKNLTKPLNTFAIPEILISACNFFQFLFSKEIIPYILIAF